MAQAEMQGRKAAHREPDDVGRAVAHGAHHVGQVLGRADLIIGADACRHIRRRIAARAINRAAIVAGKKPTCGSQLRASLETSCTKTSGAPLPTERASSLTPSLALISMPAEL